MSTNHKCMQRQSKDICTKRLLVRIRSFINDDHLQMYKTLQLITSLITTNTNTFTSINVINNTCAHVTQTQTLLKMPSLSNLGLN